MSRFYSSLTLVLTACLLLVSSPAQSQVPNPDSSLVKGWNMRQKTYELAMEFGVGEYGTTSIMQDSIEALTARVAPDVMGYPNRFAVVMATYDSKPFTEHVTEQLNKIEKLGDVQAFLNAELADRRTRPVARALIKKGVPFHQVLTQGVYAPQEKRTVIIKIVDMSSGYGDKLAEISPRLDSLRSRLERIEQRQDEIGELALSNAGKLNNHTSRLDNLQRRLDSLANASSTDIIPGGLGLTLGVGVSGSDYPSGLNNTRSYLGEVTAGINWRERLFITATYGGSPFSGQITLPDGDTDLHANTRRASLSWLIPSLPLGPLVGWEKRQDVPSEFDGYVTQKSGPIFGLHGYIPLSDRFAVNLKAFATPGTVVHWDRTEVEETTSSIGISGGIVIRLN